MCKPPKAIVTLTVFCISHQPQWNPIHLCTGEVDVNLELPWIRYGSVKLSHVKMPTFENVGCTASDVARFINYNGS